MGSLAVLKSLWDIRDLTYFMVAHTGAQNRENFRKDIRTASTRTRQGNLSANMGCLGRTVKMMQNFCLVSAWN